MPSVTSSTFALVIRLPMQETESEMKSTSARRASLCSIGLIVLSSIAFAHYEVQTAEHGRNVTNQASRQKLRQNAEVNKGWSANFQPIRNASASAVNVKAKFPLGIFGSEIDFAGWRIEPFGDHDEMMN